MSVEWKKFTPYFKGEIVLRPSTSVEYVVTIVNYISSSEFDLDVEECKLVTGEGNLYQASVETENGGSGGEEELLDDYVCGEVIISLRAVVLINGKLYHFNPADLSHFMKCIGVSKQSGVVDSKIEVALNDMNIINPNWGLTPSSIYFSGTSGQLTSTVPLINILQQVGVAITANELLVKVIPPIRRT